MNRNRAKGDDGSLGCYHLKILVDATGRNDFASLKGVKSDRIAQTRPRRMAFPAADPGAEQTHEKGASPIPTRLFGPKGAYAKPPKAWMILVDTSIWIEFLRGKEPISAELSTLLDGGQILTIEPIFGELLQGCRNNAETAMAGQSV